MTRVDSLMCDGNGSKINIYTYIIIYPTDAAMSSGFCLGKPATQSSPIPVVVCS